MSGSAPCDGLTATRTSLSVVVVGFTNRIISPINKNGANRTNKINHATQTAPRTTAAQTTQNVERSSFVALIFTRGTIACCGVIIRWGVAPNPFYAATAGQSLRLTSGRRSRENPCSKLEKRQLAKQSQRTPQNPC